jgi:hypothetical protein
MSKKKILFCGANDKMSSLSPKLRTVDKSKAPYPSNKFSKNFPFLLGKEIIYLLATKSNPSLKGSEWEEIFAHCIGAEWKPSNVGLDDVVLDNTAWGAKTIKSTHPSQQKIVRLISGRNSPVYSYEGKIDINSDPAELGRSILEIWNERVSSVRQKFKNLRAIVLIKSESLSELRVFESETVRYDADLYEWKRNKNHNLEGIDKTTNFHKFTWQPHGSQFTILEKAPDEGLLLKVEIPQKLDKEKILDAIGFKKDWITVINCNG